MFLDKKSLILAKKLLFISCMVFVFQMAFPANLILAAEVDITHGRGPAELSFVNYSDNPALKNKTDLISVVENLPLNNDLPYYTTHITITAYSSTEDQCDSDPFTAATGKHVYWGMLASNGYPFGTKIQIPEFGNKIFSIEDRMNDRYYHHLDIWMPTREQAKAWGSRYVEVKIFK